MVDRESPVKDFTAGSRRILVAIFTPLSNISRCNVFNDTEVVCNGCLQALYVCAVDVVQITYF